MHDLQRIFLRSALALCLISPSQLLAQAAVWTWHNDIGRTGQNASETTLTPSNVNKTGFGKLLSCPVDGQVYAQPLVLWDGTNSRNLVYVVTQNDSIYMFDGTNIPLNGQCTPLATNTGLLPSGESAVDCHLIGSKKCKTISPTVGILGTPVIDEKTNHIYFVTYSTDGTNFNHRIHALFTGLNGTTALAEDTAYTGTANPHGVLVSSGSFSPAFLSVFHIQRPGLLLLPGTQALRPQVYIGFSMMDGLTQFPPGFIFRYFGDDLTQAPVVYTTEPNTTTGAGGGVWMDGAGLAAGVDSSTGGTYLYVATADGTFDSPNSTLLPCYDCGDSFIKLGPEPTANLAVSSSFTPSDQSCRFINNYNTNPDDDFGSGGVLLIPDGLLGSWPYLAVSADKPIPPTTTVGNIYVIPRGSPGFYNPGSSCFNGSDGITEELAGTGLYHNTPAFWTTTSGATSGYLYYSSQNGVISQYPVSNSSCTSGAPPLCNAINTSLDPTGAHKTFAAGVTPTVSSNGTSTSSGIVWAIDGASVEDKINGSLWAFKASDMTHLYNSNLCKEDFVNSATQFSVPTVANGKVYVGAQSDNNLILGKGTFYIFGLITGKTCTAP